MPTRSTGPLVLVTGGNRGIGFETCRALAAKGAHVLLGSRKHAEGERAAHLLQRVGHVECVTLDVADPKSIAAAAAHVEKTFGALDVLINNAGIYLDANHTALDVPDEIIEKTWNTNVVGAWRLCRAFAPAMVKRGSGRILNVSSGLGQISAMGGGTPAYRVSKAALDALTLVLASELRGTGVTVAALNPGWVRTEMGGMAAPREPGPVGETFAAAALEDDRTGVFLKDGEVIPW